MKFSGLLLFGIFMQVYGFSIPKVYNTKAEGCVNGRCGPHCDVNGVKIFPGERFNLEGECERLSCTQDFTVTFSTCRGFDIYDEFNWVGRDNSKPYPECCGTKSSLKRPISLDFE